ncbi:MAG: hypothetical protein DDT40_01971 [candidate division WS2 bacterium]|nr:hypothetical protein [Candidatus Psychracetigena formicireducens]
MYQIEQALIGATTWTEWKYNIKNKYDNETENQLYNLSVVCTCHILLISLYSTGTCTTPRSTNL